MDKSDFILAGINDTQSTIRATDAKVVAFLAGVFLPFSKVDRIWAHLEFIYETHSHSLGFVLGISFLLSWVIVILILLRTISAIDNPRDHIPDNLLKKGSFYAAGLYKFKWIDSLYNRSSVKTDATVESFETHYPAEKERTGQSPSFPIIVEELAFEHMKLAYIREIKIHRLKCAFGFMNIWLALGLTIYLVSKFSS